MPDIVLSGSLTAADASGGTAPPAGSVLDLGCEDRPAVSIDLAGTFTGTVVIEAAAVAGPAAADWFTPVVLTAAGAAGSASLTAAARRFLSGAGLGRVRLRCTSLVSGTPTAALRAGQGFISTGQLPAALVNGALPLTGDTAHGATDAGNPVEIGFGAVAHGANPTAVAAGQRTRGYANRAGIPFVIGGHPNVINTTQNFAAAQTNTVLVANTAGAKIVVTGFLVTVSNAVTVNVAVGIGLAQTVTPPSGTTNRFGSHPGIAPGSGFGRGNGAGMIATGADGDQVLLTSGAVTGGSVDVSCTYFTIAS